MEYPTPGEIEDAVQFFRLRGQERTISNDPSTESDPCWIKMVVLQGEFLHSSGAVRKTGIILFAGSVTGWNTSVLLISAPHFRRVDGEVLTF